MDKSYKRDPAAALLEVLDPAQNDKFQDQYLRFGVDLSKVIFIATANSLDTIHPALLERMSVESLSSYTPQEKLQIAKSYIIPRQLAEHKHKTEIKFSDNSLLTLIDECTCEAGVRRLRQLTNQIIQTVIAANIRKGVYKSKAFSSANIRSFLRDELELFPACHTKHVAHDKIGRVNGLAWTSVGGVLLPIQVKLLPGTGQIQTTGKLGDVMQESIKVAKTVAYYEYVLTKLKSIRDGDNSKNNTLTTNNLTKHNKSDIKNNATKDTNENLTSIASTTADDISDWKSEIAHHDAIDLANTIEHMLANPDTIIKNPKLFAEYNTLGFHLHAPAGATEKNGPSAGLAITTGLYSILSRRPVKGNIAVTER